MRRGASGLNLLLAIDKPAGMSSHDVVDRVRRSLGERRVGHAGTLDPAATGVLVVGVGQGTRLMGMLTMETKAYIARVCFGAQTNTDDAEGEVIATAAIPGTLYDEDFARETLSSKVGKHMQVPPAFSAISVGGERSYKRARAGEAVELEPRPIEVFSANLLGIDAAEGVSWDCAFEVSKGTYVRALARDLGREVGSAAHLSRLCRSASGGITLASCVSLERIKELGAKRVREVALDPVIALGLPVHKVTGPQLRRVSSGQSLSLTQPLARGERCSLVYDGKLLGIWEERGGMLVPKANFPAGIEGVGDVA